MPQLPGIPGPGYILRRASRILSGKYGRRLIFCNATVLVTGISIRIKDLYSACGKIARYETVDGNRENYAFIGLVIPKEQIAEAFDVPYTAFSAKKSYIEANPDIIQGFTNALGFHFRVY